MLPLIITFTIFGGPYRSRFSAIPANFLQYLQIFCNTADFLQVLQETCRVLQKICGYWRKYTDRYCRKSVGIAEKLQVKNGVLPKNRFIEKVQSRDFSLSEFG